MRKKLLSIILTAAMAVTLMAGCGSNGSDEGMTSMDVGSDEDVISTTDSTDSESAEKSDPFGKADPPVEISVVQSVTVGTDQEDRSENNNFCSL